VIPRTGRFQRSDRLRSSRDFRRASREGRRVAGRHFVVQVAARPHEVPEVQGASGGPGRRLGVTVSRRVGNAVVRNRVKRAIREWFRRWRWELEDGIDVVVIARPSAADLSGREISETLCRQLELTSATRDPA